MTLSPRSFGVRASFHMPARVHDAVNNQIEEGINTNHLDLLPSAMDILKRSHFLSVKEYIENGSYYPALRQALRSGHYEEVLEAIQVLEEYAIQLLEKYEMNCQTSTIGLCKAACLFKLGKIKECSLYLEKTPSDELFKQLEELIPLCIQGEAILYQTFYDYCRQPGQSD